MDDSGLDGVVGISDGVVVQAVTVDVGEGGGENSNVGRSGEAERVGSCCEV